MLKTIVRPIRSAVKPTRPGTLRGRPNRVRMPFIRLSHERPCPANALTVFDYDLTGDYEFVAAVKAARGEGK